MMIFKQIPILIIFITTFAPICGRTLITGNGVDEGKTFVAPVGILKREADRQSFLVGASQRGSRQFSIARYAPAQVKKSLFFGITPELVQLNKVDRQLSPLHDAQISFLSPLSAGRCAAVVAHKPASLFVVDDAFGAQLLSLNFLDACPDALDEKDMPLDAGMKPNGGIVGLEAATTGVKKTDRVFAAVRSAGQNEFGVGDSGIAACVVGDREKKKAEEKKKEEATSATPAEKKKSDEKKKPEMKKKGDGKKNDASNNDQNDKKETEKKEYERVLVQFDCAPFKNEPAIEKPAEEKKASTENEAAQEKKLPKPSAASLNIGTPAVAIKVPVNHMGTIIDMHWSEMLQALYVAYDVVGAGDEQAGARSIVVGRFNEQNKLEFHAIAPDGVFVSGNNNEIIGACGANAAVTAHLVRAMRTSTALDYLVVLGGNGTALETKNTVYALPLVNRLLPGGVMRNPEDDLPVHGTLANVATLEQPKLNFRFANSNPGKELFDSRYFVRAAETNSEIYKTTDNAAWVGQGPVPFGSVDSMILGSDAVFVTVSACDAPDAKVRTAIYHSQALFNQYGVIVGWTAWARAVNITDPVFLVSYEYANGTFIYGAGADRTAIDTIYQTEWGSGATPGLADIVTELNRSFNKETGGLQSLIYFAPQTPGVSGCGILAGIGLNKIVFVPPLIPSLSPGGATQPSLPGATAGGAPLSGVLRSTCARGSGGQVRPPLIPSENAKHFCSEGRPPSADVLRTMADRQDEQKRHIHLVSNATLESLGALQALEIGAAENNAWLFVGGIHGLAVLCDEKGNGWGSADTVISALNTQAYRFKKVGTYQSVKKLIVDNDFLYLLTDDRLDRIDLKRSDFANDRLVTTTVATPAVVASTDWCTFVDMVVSEQLAIVATGAGLIRNGSDIRAVQTPADAQWSFIETPESFLPPLKLIPLSSTYRPQDLSRGCGGQLYVLHGHAGQNRSMVSRYYIGDTVTRSLSDDTVSLVQDWSAPDVLAPFQKFAAYRTCFAVDGALVLTGQTGTQTQKCAMLAGGGTGIALPLNLEKVSAGQEENESETLPVNEINAIVRDGASGSWIFAGDFGVRVNE